MTRRRAMWDDIIPAWDHAQATIRTSSATPSQRAVLGAVLWLLARHQRTNDRIRLSQVAREAGIWNGKGDCPRSASAAAGRHLQALAELGAITYAPSPGRGSGCLIGLPNGAHGTRETVLPDRAHGTRETDPQPRAPHARNGKAFRAPSTKVSRASDAGIARTSSKKRAHGARAPEEYSEEITEEYSEERAARDGATAPSAAHADVRTNGARHDDGPAWGEPGWVNPDPTGFRPDAYSEFIFRRYDDGPHSDDAWDLGLVVGSRRIPRIALDDAGAELAANPNRYPHPHDTWPVLRRHADTWGMELPAQPPEWQPPTESK